MASSGRAAVVAVGLVGLLTSMHLACSSDNDPPRRTNPITDSGPRSDANEPAPTADASMDASNDASNDATPGGYGYGYGPDGCYGYGYGYAPTYGGYAADCP